MAPDHGILPWHDGSNLLPPLLDGSTSPLHQVMASCIVCQCACGCRWFVQLIRLVWYIQVLWFHQGQRVALRLPVLFWLFYLVTPLFPGFGSGMYGVISLVSCTFVPCTHGPFLAWPCAFLSWPLPCVFLSALHAQHTAHFACNNLSANNWKI